MASCDLASLPAGLSHLTALQELSLEDNWGLRGLKQLTRLQPLSRLGFAGCGMDLPAALFSIPFLRVRLLAAVHFSINVFKVFRLPVKARNCVSAWSHVGMCMCAQTLTCMNMHTHACTHNGGQGSRQRYRHPWTPD